MAILGAGCANDGAKTGVPTEAVKETEFNVRSASVVIIRQNLVERHAKFEPHYRAGALGFTHNGFIAVRDPALIPADTLVRIARLVAEENKDRETMYREIARANGRPDWEPQLQNIFGERWIKRAPLGWYFRDPRGQWTMKEARHNQESSTWLTPWLPAWVPSWVPGNTR
jgi:uncharacterized protein YdbL (DUF1318 family)